MSDFGNHNMNDCGCCEGQTAQTPVEVANRPGLSAVAYRAGTHSQFKQSMLARLSAADLPQLSGLRTSDDDDFSIAFLDAWATVADVLTFYQQRIANESYLLTATERRSLLELARLIGYELGPGVAASTYLAFTLETGVGAPGKATIDIGTRVQSVPGPDEKPQTFETVEKIEARAEWNALKPRLTLPQTISTSMPSILLEGTNTNLRLGDRLLIVVSATDREFRRITKVEVDNARQQTKVDLYVGFVLKLILPSAASPSTPAGFMLFSEPLNDETIKTAVLDHAWRQRDLASYAQVQRWPLGSLLASVNSAINREAAPASTETGVFAFRVRASLFGHNAPDWTSMPERIRTAYGDDDDFTKIDWDNPAPAEATKIELDRVYSEILPGSWVVITRSGSTLAIDRVYSSEETAASRNTLSGKITELTLEKAKITVNNFSDLRNITVYAQSEGLVAANKAISDDLAGNSIELDQAYDLNEGQSIMVTGETLAGVIKSELAVLADVQKIDLRTHLKLAANLAGRYQRKTVTINANIALSTHGETTEEVLGSGESTKSHQHFALRQSPLTYSTAENPTGAQSTLEVRVGDLLWHEVPSLYGRGPNDRVYVTRSGDDGRTTVRFGEGRTGARLPTGSENITARYRKGIGLEGLVKAGQLSLLMTRPLGVRTVTNPLDAEGAADPETLDDARPNAPLTVLTLGRVVSLQDYEDFARAFQGIAKASATWTWNGQMRGVFVTIAGPEGATVDQGSVLYKNLLSAMQQAGEPFVPLSVKSYRPALFRLKAGVKIDPAYKHDLVLASVQRALHSHFSFQARSFGQGVALSEVVAVMQAVAGVIAVDVDTLHRFEMPAIHNDRLLAAAPQAGSDGAVLAAELLTLDLKAKVDLGVIT